MYKLDATMCYACDRGLKCKVHDLKEKNSVLIEDRFGRMKSTDQPTSGALKPISDNPNNDAT